MRKNLRLIFLILVLVGVFYFALLNMDFSKAVTISVPNEATINETSAIEWSREALRLSGEDLSNLKPVPWPGETSAFSKRNSSVSWRNTLKAQDYMVTLTKEGTSVNCRIIAAP